MFALNRATLFRDVELSSVETVLLTVYGLAVPFLSVFALLTFVAATLIQAFVLHNHSRNEAVLKGGHMQSPAQEVSTLPLVRTLPLSTFLASHAPVSTDSCVPRQSLGILLLQTVDVSSTKLVAVCCSGGALGNSNQGRCLA